MATSIQGSKIVFPDNTEQTRAEKVLNVHFNKNSTRQSIPTNSGNQYIWQGNTFTRSTADSSIFVQASLKGHDDYSYPYYHTFVELRNQDGTKYTSVIGSMYIHHVTTSGSGHQDNQHVNWTVRKMWTPSEIGSNFGGTWEIWYGYGGPNSNRPFVIWNPNSSDDSRGTQQYSTSTVWEFAPN